MVESFNPHDRKLISHPKLLNCIPISQVGEVWSKMRKDSIVFVP